MASTALTSISASKPTPQSSTSKGSELEIAQLRNNVFYSKRSFCPRDKTLINLVTTTLNEIPKGIKNVILNYAYRFCYPYESQNDLFNAQFDANGFLIPEIPAEKMTLDLLETVSFTSQVQRAFNVKFCLLTNFSQIQVTSLGGFTVVNLIPTLRVLLHRSASSNDYSVILDDQRETRRDISFSPDSEFLVMHQISQPAPTARFFMTDYNQSKILTQIYSLGEHVLKSEENARLRADACLDKHSNPTRPLPLFSISFGPQTLKENQPLPAKVTTASMLTQRLEIMKKPTKSVPTYTPITPAPSTAPSQSYDSTWHSRAFRAAGECLFGINLFNK